MTKRECLQFIAGGREILAVVKFAFSDGYATETIPCPIEGDWKPGWIQRMGGRFGGSVFDREGGPSYGWDWGQALCRERYGLDWNSQVHETPDEEDVRIAQEWEAGKWPDWAYTAEYDPLEVP